MRTYVITLHNFKLYLGVFFDGAFLYNLRQWSTWYTIALFYSTFVM